MEVSHRVIQKIENYVLNFYEEDIILLITREINKLEFSPLQYLFTTVMISLQM